MAARILWLGAGVRPALLAFLWVGLWGAVGCTDGGVGASDGGIEVSDPGFEPSDLGPGDAVAEDVEPEVVADVAADAEPDAAPDVLPDVKPDVVPDATPDAEPDVIPDATPDAEPDVIPDATPDAEPDVVPDAEPDVVADAEPDVVPDAEPDVVPDTEPDVVPDAEPDAEPDVVPDAEPDAELDVVPDVIVDAEPEVQADVVADADAVEDAEPDAVEDVAPPQWVLAPPAGVLVFMAGPDCPGGWAASAAARGRLIKGVAEPGQVGLLAGTALSSSAPPTHSHSFSAQLPIPSIGMAAASGCCNNSTGGPGTYQVDGQTSAATDGIPSVHQLVCEGLDAGGADDHPFPAGTILFFDRADCPTGWELVGEAEGRFIVGNPVGGNPMAAIGEPLASQSLPVHSHPVSASVTISQQNIAGLGGGTQFAGKGTATMQGQTEQTEGGWPYLQALVCMAKAKPPVPAGFEVVGASLPQDTLAFFKSPSCPAGWTASPGHAGRVVAGLSDGAAPAVLGTALGPGEVRQHSHPFSGTFSLDVLAIALASGGFNGNPGKSGSYPYSGTTSAASGQLPYLTLTACLSN